MIKSERNKTLKTLVQCLRKNWSETFILYNFQRYLSDFILALKLTKQSLLEIVLFVKWFIFYVYSLIITHENDQERRNNVRYQSFIEFDTTASV